MILELAPKYKSQLLKYCSQLHDIRDSSKISEPTPKILKSAPWFWSYLQIPQTPLHSIISNIKCSSYGGGVFLGNLWDVWKIFLKFDLLALVSLNIYYYRCTYIRCIFTVYNLNEKMAFDEPQRVVTGGSVVTQI